MWQGPRGLPSLQPWWPWALLSGSPSDQQERRAEKLFMEAVSGGYKKKRWIEVETEV